MSGVLMAGLMGVPSGFGQGTDPSPKPSDSADLASLEANAEAGDVSAQTRLADHYCAVADFAKAVPWYRKAASRGELEAQLSLASCYLAGQGVEKNPTEAARWLRAAAARLEQGHPTAKAAATPPPQPTAALRLSPHESTAAPTANLPANGRISSRIQRVLTVQVVHPELQEPPEPLQLLKATP